MKLRPFTPEAILIVGSTGSGKTPLGDLLEKNGLNRKKCHHFDFGAHLRAIAQKKRPGELFSGAEINLVQNMLNQGTLLTARNFQLAYKILARFIKIRGISYKDLIVLNGIPRHVQQARKIDSIVNLRLIIHLNCAPKTSLIRIIHNLGGDRAKRPDDSIGSIKNRISLFKRKTLKMLGYYRLTGRKIIKIAITKNTQPPDILKSLTAESKTISRFFVGLKKPKNIT